MLFQKDKTIFILILIILLGLFLSSFFFFGPAFINGSDNYEYVYMAYLLANGRNKELPKDGVLETRYILLGGIALFYKLFGFTAEASAMFGTLCFLLTILIVYLIGKNLYNKTAGIIAAFLYSFFPLVVIQSSSVGDDAPIALFVSLSLLSLVKMKNEKNKEKRKVYQFLCGLLPTLGILTSTASGIIFAFCFLYFILYFFYYNFKKEKNRKKEILNFLIGICFGVIIIMLLGAAIMNEPLHVFRVIFEWYPSPLKHGFSNSPNFNLVFNAVFPYGKNELFEITKNLIFVNLNKIFSFFNSDGGQFNLFGYFLIGSALYLISTKEKRAIIPLAWFAFSFLYLSFGPTALSHRYLFIAYAPRFNIIFVPAVCLVIAIAFSKILKLKNKFLNFFLFALLLLIFVSSFLEVFYIKRSEYKITLPLLQIAEAIKSLPSNVSICKGFFAIPIEVYVNFKRDFISIGERPENVNCTKIGKEFYVITIENKSLEENCNLLKIYKSYIPSWLENYSYYDGIGKEYFYNLTLYKKQ
ncbi:MAG: glycosyltransferase family 39 protein [Candidatus Micrarchaeia archaeon]